MKGTDLTVPGRTGLAAGSATVLALALALAGCGKHLGDDEIEGKRRPASATDAVASAQRTTATVLAETAGKKATPKQILFGDLHVHTTFSTDAFFMSLPILEGEGAHPPADACDFARYCSALDFWSITDHAEALTPARWADTREMVRQCNELAGDPADPDLVTYLGWEWTQVGLTPEGHYGHKNVILLDTEDGEIPRRPVAAGSFTGNAMRSDVGLRQKIGMPLLDWPNRQRYWDLFEYLRETRETPRCATGVDSRELPDDCMEYAETPAELFEKLDQWGSESLVIPHGTTWGLYTPQGTSLDKQLAGPEHDPDRQRLIEVFSGHGNSEEFRRWRAVETVESGHRVCPEPWPGYEPCCWRAGEIIRSRCDDPESELCEKRVETARRQFLEAGATGRMTVPTDDLAEWGDCGQCQDCFAPSYQYRPGNSAQYAMAISNFDDPGEPRRFRFGFMASSDNHSARPGTGYKEYKRRMMTEAAGSISKAWSQRILEPDEPTDESIPFNPATTDRLPVQFMDFERGSSFFLTGGLIAVHSPGRDRHSIWSAMQTREVYGTSGPRILLWFDLLNSTDGEVPMGTEAKVDGAPRFRVRAAGSFKQAPGCPDYATSALKPERLERLCRGECYNPTDERHRIERIEIVRIRPQIYAGEPVATLIDDPWKVVECPPGPEGCVVEFSDEEATGADRETLYYARALQQPTPAVNVAGLRCIARDDQGICTEVEPCYGDYRTDFSDDCLAGNNERAWSSPIFVTRTGARG